MFRNYHSWIRPFSKTHENREGNRESLEPSCLFCQTRNTSDGASAELASARDVPSVYSCLAIDD